MVEEKIIKFFRKHHVLTIATSVANEPWCANCFYVYLEEENALVFTTDSDTRHGQEFINNPLIAGSVVLETMIIGKIRGIQFQGLVSEPKD
ncbi:MAG: pyridoxamine 5'-phosphate oxidase family protein [Bacteroidales bacterium]